MPLGHARVEDERLVRGAGRFADDVDAIGHLIAVVLRSNRAHARVLEIRTEHAKALEGVRAVLVAADLAADGIGAIPWEVCPPLPAGQPPPVEGDPAIAPPQPLLAGDRVRYVGEPIALIVAGSRSQALDAAESIEVEYEDLPANCAAAKASDPGGLLLHDQFEGNVCFKFGLGDAEAAEAAFANADLVVELSAINQRLAPVPIEPRSYVAAWDAGTERWTLHAAAGKPHPIRHTLARFIFGVAEDRIRVVVKDVGGSFGGKNVLYAEAALVLWAARRLGQPVRWTQERSESFLSDVQGRDHDSRAALALTRDGKMLGIRVNSIVNLGAWLCPRGVMPAISGTRLVSGVYRIPAVRFDVTAVFTNSVPTGPYRGTGAPEVMFVLERLVDLAASRLGIPAIELRRRNLLQADGQAVVTGGGHYYTACDFPAVFDRAMKLADWEGFPQRRAASKLRGVRRGFGVSYSIEAFGARYGEEAEVRIAADGSVVLLIGTQSAGQSHETVYASIAAERLGIPLERISVVQGDTDRIARGNGTGASRSLTVGGSAVLGACEAVLQAGLDHAAVQLEAAPADVVIEGGRYRIAGTDRSVGLEEVASRCGGLQATGAFKPEKFNFPYGCHVAEVEVDEETGQVTLLDYSGVHDCGRPISRSVVLGQLHGGLVQGVGQALFEAVVHDPASGQVLSGSLMDYALPRADDVPGFRIELFELPSSSNPLGAKAVGEAGPTASPPAVINAIVDALTELGVRHVEMPATPERVWQAIQAARQRGGA